MVDTTFQGTQRTLANNHQKNHDEKSSSSSAHAGASGAATGTDDDDDEKLEESKNPEGETPADRSARKLIASKVGATGDEVLAMVRLIRTERPNKQMTLMGFARSAIEQSLRPWLDRVRAVDAELSPGWPHFRLVANG
ncbi:hypothetical protein [Dactylosporangium sp. CA-233914]|uniref:hypothetical protein n=1 Tax=Dactylosporangium sp. CA-233914 TaxID=3239934 RepID=UPI003D90D38C